MEIEGDKCGDKGRMLCNAISLYLLKGRSDTPFISLKVELVKLN